MEGVLLDTDVYSYFFKGDTRARRYATDITGRRVHVSFATVAELYRWAIAHGWGTRRIKSLDESLANCVVLEYDQRLAWEWARIMSIKGRPITHGDAWVAAAALRHGIPLVTHNRKHFEHIPGLTVISEA